MSERKRIFHTFTDGSAYESQKRYGAGGVIYETGNREPVFSFSIPLYGRHSSLTAEVYAVVHALDALPKGSDVVVHSDFEVMCRKINKRKIELWSQDQRKMKHVLACRALFNSVSRHREVTAEYISYKNSGLIEVAHGFARAATHDEVYHVVGPNITKNTVDTIAEMGSGKGGTAPKKRKPVPRATAIRTHILQSCEQAGVPVPASVAA